MPLRPPRPEPSNHIELGGEVERVDPLRTTPAGIPVAAFLLGHRSRQTEAGLAREARLRIRVLAAGPLAEQAARLAPGTQVEVSGFLSRSSYRREDTHLALHAQHIRIVEDEASQRKQED